MQFFYKKKNVCGRVPWLNQYWPGGFIVFVVLCPGTPVQWQWMWPCSLAEPVLAGWVYSICGSMSRNSRSVAVVLVLKRLRRQVNGLKSHPTDWEKPGIEPATPGLQDIGLSPTPRRLQKTTYKGMIQRILLAKVAIITSRYYLFHLVINMSYFNATIYKRRFRRTVEAFLYLPYSVFYGKSAFKS